MINEHRQMKRFNVDVFDLSLRQQDYRTNVYDIVKNWSFERCLIWINNLQSDQHDYPVPVSDSIDHIQKVVSMVVFGWGWEGCEQFVKVNR